MTSKLENEIGHIIECYLDIPDGVTERETRQREHIHTLLGIVHALMWKAEQ